MRVWVYISAIVLMGLIYACKKSEVDTTIYDAGYKYFPVNIGHEIIYDVDSVIYDDFNDTIITYKFQKRLLVADTFTALDGSLNQRLEWYTRSNDTLPWEFRHSGSCLRNNLVAEVVQFNQRIIKLVFPVVPGKTWDAYAKTTVSGKDNFYYDKTNLAYTDTLNGQHFLNTLIVTQRDDSNLIEVRKSAEQYAPGVGLIYVKFDSLDTQFDNFGNPVTRGLRYRERIRSFVK